MTFLTITDSKNINIAIQYLEMCNFNLDVNFKSNY